MAATSINDLIFLFKRRYANRKPNPTLKRRHPLMAMLKTTTDWTGGQGSGTGFFYATKTADPQGLAGSFTIAQNNAGASTGQQFYASRAPYYGYGKIKGETMLASENDEGAFLRAVTTEVDGVLAGHEDAIARALYRDGNGSRGKVATSGVSGNTVTLTVQDDVRWFWVGMVCISSANASGSSPRNAGATMKVTKTSYADGKVTFDTIVVGTTDADYLFRQGEDAATVTNIDGLSAIIPATAGTFRGVDCTVDRERLAGWYIDDSTTSFEKNAMVVITRMASYKNISMDEVVVFANPGQLLAMIERGQAKVVYDGAGNDLLVGFKTIVIMTPMGTLRVLPDADCPMTDAFALTMSTLELKGLRQVPHVITDDTGAGQFLRVSDDDAVEFRTRSFCNLIGYDPGLLGRFTLPASP